MKASALPTIRNGGSIALKDVPLLPAAEFRERVVQRVKTGARVSALFGRPIQDGQTRLTAVLAHDESAVLSLLSTDVSGAYPSLTSECPQVHLFEREIFEQCGVRPEGHPWLKPVRKDSSDFFQVQGDEIHEVAVGPVHAGVIEPGHFRFQCHGEIVYNLEISLGYQHRGVERALVGGPNKRTIHLIETLAGDTSIGHATAYAEIVESLSSVRAPARAQALRGIMLELERLANHTGDLGALANDVGYLPTASFCGRLRGDFLNVTALVCGNRFGRGFVRPGGARFDVDGGRVNQMQERLQGALKDVTQAAELLWETPSVMGRFEETGAVSKETARELGLVGPAARACGVERDVRTDFPFGIYRFANVPVSSWATGDVFARAYVRWLEIQKSATFVREQLQRLPAGAVTSETRPLASSRLAVSLVEGWRGEICHVAVTDEAGRFAHYKVVDPSFHNWTGLATALRDQQISDFPLCNKSFNLSYCGFDL
jgi:Ni,Fe-hydrogenase III large subunit